jgi:O-antigen ligase
MRKRKQKSMPRQTNFDRIIFWSFFVFLILVLPLVHSNTTLDTVLMPRLMTLSGFLLVFSLFVVFVRIGRKGDFGFVRLPVLWVAAGFLIVTILTSSGALNFKESLFDISKTTVFVVTLFYALFTLQQYKDWPADLARIITIVALIAVSIGSAQYISRVLPYPDPLLPDRRAVVYLVDGLMGHKNLFASSLMLMLPFLVYGCIKFKGAWKWTVVTATVLVIFLIVLLMTRAVWLGLFAGISFTVLLLIVKGQLIGLSFRFRMVMTVGSFLILAAGYGVLSKMEAGDDFTPVERIKSIVSPRDAHNQPRIKIWSITLEIGKEHPVTGVGPGNWKLKMADYLEGFGFLREQINWYRPHNDFLWNLAEKGIFGLLLFLGLFGLTAYYLLYVMLRSERKDDKIFSLCLFAGLIV